MQQWDEGQLKSKIAARILSFLHIPGRIQTFTITHEHAYVLEKVQEDIEANGPLDMDEERLGRIVDGAMAELKKGARNG